MDFLFRCIIPVQTSASGSGLHLWIRSLTMFLDFLFVCLTESPVAQDGLELTMYWIPSLSASTFQVLVMEPSDLCTLGKYSTELKFLLLKKTKYLYKNILITGTSPEILKHLCVCVCVTHMHTKNQAQGRTHARQSLPLSPSLLKHCDHQEQMPEQWPPGNSSQRYQK